MQIRGGGAIIPIAVLDQIANDPVFSETTRATCRVTADHAPTWRAFRASMSLASRHTRHRPAGAQPPLPALAYLFSCRGSVSLPGELIDADELTGNTRVNVIATTIRSIMSFYKTIFNRHSIDNVGMGIIVSMNYANTYCNAHWNGQQMVLGDGDGDAFGDFAHCEDVLAHEIAHGVTQFTIGLGYADEAGALNESISDAFAVVFCQWRQHQTCERANWMIGTGLIGPGLRRLGYVGLRNLAVPDADGVLLRQPRHMRDYVPGGDPHINCGIPNHAFYLAAQELGGNTWDRIAPIWYSALVASRRSPNMSFAEFARLTIHRAQMLFRVTPVVARAVENAWRQVGVL